MKSLDTVEMSLEQVVMPLDVGDVSVDLATKTLATLDLSLEPSTMTIGVVEVSPRLPTKLLDRATMTVDHEAKEVKPLDGGADVSIRNRDLEHESLDEEKKNHGHAVENHTALVGELEPARKHGAGARQLRPAGRQIDDG